MEQPFDEMHRDCWEHPERYALVKDVHDGVEFFCIFTIHPRLMMMLCDDFAYALRLSRKMIEHGVKVFDTSDSFSAWCKEHSLH